MKKTIILVVCTGALILISSLIIRPLFLGEEIQLLSGKGIDFVKSSSAAHDVHNGKVREWSEENIVDNNMSSHWCTADVTGEWAYISLDKNYPLSKIGFVNGNGYWQHPEHKQAYFMDARIKEVKIELSNGWKKVIQLADHGDLQFFDLDQQESDYIKLTTLSLYPMQKWSHVCLAEIQVFANTPPSKRTLSSMSKDEDLKKIKDTGALKKIAELRKNIAKNPNNAKAHITLGQVFLKWNLYRKAMEEFKTAETIDPNRGELQYLKALTHMLLGERTDSLSSISKSLNLFTTQGKQEEFKKAFALLRKLKNMESSH